jgi:multidrug efflux pump subunit AcrB
MLQKENAILMVDFAGSRPKHRKECHSVDAIHQACLLRFAQFLMTPWAALFGALPLALGTGVGSELRRPPWLSTIVGGLNSQAICLTLFTTPVVYLYLDRFQTWLRRFIRTSP